MLNLEMEWCGIGDRLDNDEEGNGSSGKQSGSNE